MGLPGKARGCSEILLAAIKAWAVPTALSPIDNAPHVSPPPSVLDPAYLPWKHKYRVRNKSPSSSNLNYSRVAAARNLDFEVHGNER